MNKFYTKVVPFELSLKLKEAGYPQDLWWYYLAYVAVDEVHVTDEFSTKSYKKGELYASDEFTSIDEYDGDVELEDLIVEAPHYADVLDWLMEKGMCVSMFSINTDNKVTHTSSLMDISNECKCDMTFGYKDNWYESANVAIEKALEVLSKKVSTKG